MKSFKFSTTILIVSSLVLFSCVPQRRYLETKQKKMECEQTSKLYKDQLRKDTIKITEMTAQATKMNKEITALKKDTALLGNSLRKLTKQYDKIDALNDELLRKQKMRSVQDAAEIQKLLIDLQKAKEDLQAKEDALKELEKALDLKKKNLDELTTQLDAKDSILNAKNKKLIELQNVLSRKDSAAKALRDKVNEALLGFKKDGLDVEMKNGKVYVSLQEKLLFQSGKWDIDPKGQKALKNLAKVLEKNPDINIVVEGHTDNLAYKGSGNIEDNWDLSTKRATAIVKFLLKHSKINPKQLTASGHGEFMSVDTNDTKEGRAKNRRTEIILTPKLDELFQIMETN
ncbi:MAG: OmpA family protein [Bacteroidales bacterium]|nr:OmpA family protein [Bacteroidales bacterium]